MNPHQISLNFLALDFLVQKIKEREFLQQKMGDTNYMNVQQGFLYQSFPETLKTFQIDRSKEKSASSHIGDRKKRSIFARAAHFFFFVSIYQRRRTAPFCNKNVILFNHMQQQYYIIQFDTGGPRDTRILVMRIHFTRALKFPRKLRTYQYKKLEIHVSRGPGVFLSLFQLTRKCKIHDLPWTQTSRKSRIPCRCFNGQVFSLKKMFCQPI